MTDDREDFRDARTAGLRARHETREARAIRKATVEEIYADLMAEMVDPEFPANRERVAGWRAAAERVREIGTKETQP